jgi:hypothetical protein
LCWENIVNNTIAHNDALATSGVITNSIGTPQASGPAGNCVQAGLTTSCPQSAGVTSTPNSSLMLAAMGGLTITCPPGNPGCKGFSNPALYNNIIYQNRSFYVGVGTLGTGTLNQQNLVSLFNAFTSTLAPTQASTGACSAATYWDLGVRGDKTTAPNSGSTFALSPRYSALTTTAGYNAGAAHNVAGNPNFVSQYCNGSRVPPECTVADGCAGPRGYGVPPGIADAVTPNPLFSLSPSATVDEGNNWINVSWGPLSLTSPSVLGADGKWGGGLPLGNYALTPGSSDIDRIPTSETLPAGVTRPTTDFFGNPRPDSETFVDVGAVESQNTGAAVAPHLTSISPNVGARGTSVSVTLTGSGLTGTSAINVSGTGVTVSAVGIVSDTTVVATFTISSTAALTARNVTVVTPNGTSNAVTFTVTGPRLTSIAPVTGARGTVGLAVTLSGSNLTGATAVNAGTGITVGAITVNPAGTQITTTFTIAANAGLGAHNVTVVTPQGTTNAVTFTVQGPTLTGFSPTLLTHNTNNNVVTLSGTDLAGATAINVSGGGGVTCTVTSSTATSITGSCNVSNTARGARNVSATSPNGNTNTLSSAFTVN